VFGVPTVIGPRHHASRDAHLMLAAGGVIEARTANEMTETLRRLFTHDDARATMTAALHTVVDAELEATERSLELVRKLLGAV
jgi:3-deoxy-D-manno-octulosonic-acid transferase